MYAIAVRDNAFKIASCKGHAAATRVPPYEPTSFSRPIVREQDWEQESRYNNIEFCPLQDKPLIALSTMGNAHGAGRMDICSYSFDYQGDCIVATVGTASPKVGRGSNKDGTLWKIRWSQDSKRLAMGVSSSSRGKICTLRESSVSASLLPQFPSDIFSLAFCDNDNVLLNGARNGSVYMCDARTSRRQSSVAGVLRGGSVKDLVCLDEFLAVAIVGEDIVKCDRRMACREVMRIEAAACLSGNRCLHIGKELRLVGGFPARCPCDAPNCLKFWDIDNGQAIRCDPILTPCCPELAHLSSAPSAPKFVGSGAMHFGTLEFIALYRHRPMDSDGSFVNNPVLLSRSTNQLIHGNQGNIV